MRIELFLSLLLFWIGAIAPFGDSQDRNNQSGASPSIISNISVSVLGDPVNVEVSFTELTKAQVSTLEHPDRIVFDFPGCQLFHAGQRIAVNRGPVVDVRAAQFSTAPPIARVVIDLSSTVLHEESYEGNKLLIKLSLSAGAEPYSSTKEKTRPPDDAKSPATASEPTSVTLPAGVPTAAMPLPASANATMSKIPPTAYSLLARAQDLTVSDLEPLETKAKGGDLESETVLALAYHLGTLLKMNDGEALHLLQQAANRGFIAAEEAMGIFCQSGFGMAPDQAQAISWYTKAAQHGSRDAATNLALMYSRGDGIQRDPVKAATWFRTAAEAGDATAQLNLAGLYHRGEGVPHDDAQAVQWLTKAADQGLLPAMLELARWDLQPEHSNTDAAILWLTKAANLHDASAQAVLGDIFADEKLGRLDYAQSVIWYRKAAEQGQMEGEFGLGSRYLLGQGVAQDMNEARRWLTPPANQGHPYAQLLLGKMFESGQGGPIDLPSATKYYELAADYGIAEAQYRLGRLLASDKGNETSLEFAYKWLVLAEESVKESAAAAQDLRKSLSTAQINRAEKEIDEWRATHRARNSNH